MNRTGLACSAYRQRAGARRRADARRVAPPATRAADSRVSRDRDWTCRVFSEAFVCETFERRLGIARMHGRHVVTLAVYAAM